MNFGKWITRITGAFIGVLSFAPHSFATPTRLSVAIDWYPNAEYAGMILAAKRGWYRNAGLDVVLTFNGTDLAGGVDRGQYDVGLLPSHRVIEAIDQGRQIRAFATHLQLDPHVLLTREGSGITHPSQLIGKRLAVFSEHEKGIYRTFLERYAVPESKVNFVHLIAKGDRELLKKIAENKIDALLAWESGSALRFSLHGVAMRHFPGYRHGFYFLGPCFFAAPRTLARKHEALRRFLSVTRLGWLEAYLDPEKTLEEIRGAYSKKGTLPKYLSSPRVQMLILELNRRYLFEGIDENDYGRMTRYGWRHSLSLASRLGMIKHKSVNRLERWVDFSVIDALDRQVRASR